MSLMVTILVDTHPTDSPPIRLDVVEVYADHADFVWALLPRLGAA